MPNLIAATTTGLTILALVTVAHADTPDTGAAKPDVAAPVNARATGLLTATPVSVNRLVGAVSNVSVQGIGNSVTGNANGGSGGSANGGTGNGGNGTGGSDNGNSTGASSGSANGQGNGASGSGGGMGDAGGQGGSNTLNAGTLSMANTMTGVAASASGILSISQNSGIGALTQQSISVQANVGVTP